MDDIAGGALEKKVGDIGFAEIGCGFVLGSELAMEPGDFAFERADSVLVIGEGIEWNTIGLRIDL
jgi:hypothetical protein